MDNKKFKTLLLQKKHIEKYFSYLKCSIGRISEKLICIGELQPHKDTDIYKIKMVYKVGNSPKIYITSPKVEYHDNIHMYKDNSLCLFHKNDFSWNDEKIIIAETIVPWVSEWIIFYEIWKIEGKWKGKEIKHLPNKK